MTAHRAPSRPVRLGDRALGAFMFALATGVVVLSLLGPLGGGVLEYHVAEDVENQVIGGDAAALALVVPVSVLAGLLAWRGRGSGAVLALAPTAFAVYLYTQLAIGGDFASRPGNSERFFVLFLVVFLLASAGLVLAWRRASSVRLPDLSAACSPRCDDRSARGRAVSRGGAPPARHRRTHPRAPLRGRVHPEPRGLPHCQVDGPRAGRSRLLC